MHVGGVISALIVLMVASGAAAAPPRAKIVADYCSVTGDLCFGVVNRSGAVYLEINTFARYFGRYTLCVRPPGSGAAGATRCGAFPVLRQRGSLWGSSVKFARQFPVGGPGVYRVTWKLAARPLGPTLRFRLPLRR